MVTVGAPIMPVTGMVWTPSAGSSVATRTLPVIAPEAPAGGVNRIVKESVAPTAIVCGRTGGDSTDKPAVLPALIVTLVMVSGAKPVLVTLIGRSIGFPEHVV